MNRASEITEFVLSEFAERAHVGNDHLSPELILPSEPAELRQYRAELERWRWARENGSLWDEAEYIKSGGGRMTDKRGVERIDEAEMTAYVNEHSASLPKRYLEVFLYFWVRKWSYSRIARKLKIEGETVRKYVKRLRDRRKTS